jgi:SAM-dependent methyltransferase
MPDRPIAYPAMRFDFGSNWRAYLDNVDVEAAAREMTSSLRAWLGVLDHKTFLDIGCGTGLASLAALRLGAKSVVSVDVLAGSIECTRELRQREKANQERWVVTQGSILDADVTQALPVSDIVYSWGVLHHTGDMRLAFERTCSRVAQGGLLWTAIYNRTWTSPIWWRIKRRYNQSGPARRFLMHGGWFAYNAFARAVGLKHPFKRERGMSVWYDAIDWLGGYPYEYASMDEVRSLVNRWGHYTLERKKPDHGFGCNEMLFRREG